MDARERIECQFFFRGVAIEVVVATALTSEEFVSLSHKREELIQGMKELVSELLKKEEPEKK